jgi:hypothetical protein
LTALMEKRPWWQQVPQFLARRVYLPVGATAILAFTLVSVKYYAPVQLAPAEPVPAGAPARGDRDVTVPAVAVSSPLVNRSDASATIVEDHSPVTVAVASPETPAEVVELMPLLMAPPAAEKPSDRLLAANLNRAASADADFGQADLGSRLSTRSRVAAPAAEDLASIPTGSTRRNRLLARYEGRQPNPEPSLPEIVRQKLARRLGDTDPDRTTRLAREIDTFSTPMPQIVALRF